MATFRKRGDRWQAVVRKGRYKLNPLTKTFAKKVLAESWARKIEDAIEDGTFVDRRPASSIYIPDMVLRYYQAIKPKSSASTVENMGYICKRLVIDFDNVSLNQCDPQQLFEYFSKRRESVKPDTVIKDIQYLSGMFRMAKIIWKLPIRENPATEARSMMNQMGLLDGANLEHDRRLTSVEYHQIRRYKMHKFGLAKYAALFLIETGMRRGELCEMKWSNIDWQSRVYEIEGQKNDKKRKRVKKGRLVPLTPLSLAILRWVRFKLRDLDKLDDMFVWSWRDPRSCSRAIKRIYATLNIESLRIHDLRHDFASIQTDAQTDIRLVAAVMGHTDLRSMKRYSHPDIKNSVDKIARRK